MSDVATQNSWDDLKTVAQYERWADPETARLAEIALAMTGIAAPCKVLDLGAGVGAMSVTAAARGLTVHASDSSTTMVDRLRERLAGFAGCSAEVMDFAHLALPDDEFDAAFGVLSVSLSPEGPRGIAEMVRVVRPGGVVCIVDWATLFGSPFFPILIGALGRLPGFTVPDFPPVGSATPEEAGALLEAGGCQHVFARTVEAVAVLPSPDTMLDEMTPIFAAFPWWVLTEQQRVELRALVRDEALAAVGPGTPRVKVQVAIGYVPERQS